MQQRSVFSSSYSLYDYKAYEKDYEKQIELFKRSTEHSDDVIRYFRTDDYWCGGNKEAQWLVGKVYYDRFLKTKNEHALKDAIFFIFKAAAQGQKEAVKFRDANMAKFPKEIVESALQDIEDAKKPKDPKDSELVLGVGEHSYNPDYQAPPSDGCRIM